MGSSRTCVLLLFSALLATAAHGGEWTNWRGPNHDGVAADTGLVSSWSTGGDNLIWRANFSGRSTAAVFDGRACAIGRDGEGIRRQEVVVCWNAKNGDKLWEWRSTPHNTFVPWQRLGWASVAGDTETGYLFAHTSDGVLIALDRDGASVLANLGPERVTVPGPGDGSRAGWRIAAASSDAVKPSTGGAALPARTAAILVEDR